MQMESTRFGTIDVEEDAVLSFPDGLIGLPGSRYALLAHTEASPFWWLHSVDHADIAVPVTKPWLFFHDYEVKVSDDDARKLQLDEPAGAEILCVVRAAEELVREVVEQRVAVRRVSVRVAVRRTRLAAKHHDQPGHPAVRAFVQ